MSIFNIIQKRNSVRSYIDKPVEKEKIDMICLAGLHSPSAMNRQPYQVIVVTDLDLKKKVVRFNESFNFWMKQAPVIFIICVKITNEGTERNKMIDVGILAQNMMLMATDLDLGTCACGAFKENEICKLFDIPKSYLPVLCVPCGYPAKKYRPVVDFPKLYEKMSHAIAHYKGRKVEDIFTWDKFY